MIKLVHANVILKYVHKYVKHAWFPERVGRGILNANFSSVCWSLTEMQKIHDLKTSQDNSKYIKFKITVSKVTKL